MGLLRLALPTEPLVSLDEVRQRLRIDEDIDDSGLVRLIDAATRRAEQKTQRAFLTQRWALTLDAFPCKNGGEIRLPLPPIQSIQSITYLDVAGVERTVPEIDYALELGKLFGAVYPVYGKSWPSTQSSRQCVRIEFTCGFGAAAEVEPDIVLAVLLLIAHFDMNREAVTDRTKTVLPMGVDDLLSPYVIPSVP